MKKSMLILLLIICSIKMINAQNLFKLNTAKVTIYGTSTAHNWSVSCDQAQGSVISTLDKNKISKIESASFTIPVKNLKSEKRSSGMDQKMYEALKEYDYPAINIQLKEIKSYPTQENTNTLVAIANISIAGVNKEEILIIQSTVNGSRNLQFSGEKKLQMTDYNISPPTAMMGMLKTGNAITIKYEFTMI